MTEEQVDFMHGDMRRLPRDRQFDAVMCVGSTLGYFEEDQNLLCLQEMYGRLETGGSTRLVCPLLPGPPPVDAGWGQIGVVRSRRSAPSK